VLRARMSDAPAAAAEPRVAMTAAEKATTEKRFQVVLRQRKYQTKKNDVAKKAEKLVRRI
jgi:hypothetical protein